MLNLQEGIAHVFRLVTENRMVYEESDGLRSLQGGRHLGFVKIFNIAHFNLILC